mgnify:FL=1
MSVMKEKVTPYKESEKGKKEQVAEMFDNIAPKYDFLNHFFSLGIDIQWRKKVRKMVHQKKVETILDLATGTGDLAIALHKPGVSIKGVDISAGMLEVGREKIKAKGLDKDITLIQGDAEDIPFPDNHFDVITVSFGARNFENLEKGLKDMLRTLKPDGRIFILEFSQPTKIPFKQFYHFYFRYIMPGIGKLVSKDNAAYTYLPESVKAFPFGDEFLGIMEKCGYKDATCKPLTMGIASIYSGGKQ